jgi:hypothetical protein
MKKLKLSEKQLVQLIERTINEQHPLRGMDEHQIIEDLDRMLDDIHEYSRTLEEFVRIQKDKLKRNDVHIEYGKGRDRRGSVGQFRNTVERLNSTADEYIVTLQAYEEAESKGYDWGKDIHEQESKQSLKEQDDTSCEGTSVCKKMLFHFKNVNESMYNMEERLTGLIKGIDMKKIYKQQAKSK